MPTLGQTVDRRISEVSEKITCENNFYRFVQKAFSVVEPGTVFDGNWHIEAICNHLDAMLMGKIQNLIINIPPGCMKSFLTSVLWPAWVWIHDPTQCFMYASYDQKLSTRDSLRCRSLIESDWYRDNWGDRFHLTSDQNEKTKFLNSKSGWRIATSTRGRGMGEHPHWLMVDDANNTAKASSEADRLYVTDEWWDGAMSSRGRKFGKKHHRVNTQQRVHPGDLTGHILKKFGGDYLHLKDPGEWWHLRLPMRWEEEIHCVTPIFEDPRKGNEGALLWGTGFDELLVESIALEMGPITAAGQLQQRPTVASGTLFKASWLKPLETDLPGEWLSPIFGEGATRGISHHEISE